MDQEIDEPSAQIEKDTFLGEYELLRRLAVGGMAEIYLARKRGLYGFEKKVVLKKILPHHALNSDFVAMFLDEARLAARLQHANVAQVYDIGCEKGHYFFTMEHIHGEDARNIVRFASRYKEPIEASLVLTVVRDAAAGLHNAHEECGPQGEPLGIVHRDVSLSNIIVSFDGCVKIVDFGVAKAAQHESETKVGTLKGKVGYMSPEQVRGKPLDRRSDIFSLGVVMYELLCAKRLYAAKTPVATAQQIVKGPLPDPRVHRDDLDDSIVGVVQKALAKNPKDRYQTAREFQVAIEKCANEVSMTLSNATLADHMQDIFSEKLTLTRLMDKDLLVERSYEVNDKSGEMNHQLNPGNMSSQAVGGKNEHGLLSVKRLAVGTDCPPMAVKDVSEELSYRIKPRRNKKTVMIVVASVLVAGLALWNITQEFEVDQAPRSKEVEDYNVMAHKENNEPVDEEMVKALPATHVSPINTVIEKRKEVIAKRRRPRRARLNKVEPKQMKSESARDVTHSQEVKIEVKEPLKEENKVWDPDSALPPM